MSSGKGKQTKGAEPATKDDVQSSQEELASMMAESFAMVVSKDEFGREMSSVDARFDKVDSRLDIIEKTMATKDMVARILAIVESLDENMKGIPAKVERLQQRVFGSRR